MLSCFFIEHANTHNAVHKKVCEASVLIQLAWNSINGMRLEALVKAARL